MEYLRFLEYPSLDVGAVIKYIMKRSETSGIELAQKSGIPPQRICDYANNRRRINAETSLALEQALNIGHRGYFYLIQTNHDIYTASLKCAKQPTPDLTKISKHIFWDSDISKINWQTNRKQIIQRAFEYGDEQTILELIRFYGHSTVGQLLSQITDRRLADRRRQNAAKYL